MNSNNYTYSSKASVFRKAYGTVCLTIILEEAANSKSKDMKKAIHLLKDEICNFLNDAELEEVFKPRETNKSRQAEKS